jgi:nucleoside-diphosphate-sugar epimerase
MNILVTGANGFIGKHICRFLQENSHNVIRIVRTNKDNLLNTYEADLSDEAAVKNLAKILKNKKIEIIIHLASKLASTNQDETEQVRVLLDNIMITKNIVTLVKDLKPQKLINFSSMAVYPNIDGDFDEKSQIKMSDNTDCMYGISKFCSENIFDSTLKNILLSHLRISQVYGDGMYENRTISVMKKELKEKNTITVFGNGERQSNFIHIDKLLKIVNYFIENNICGIYNIGDEPLSYLQLAQKIIDENGNNNSIIIKKPEGLKSKFHFNISKINEIIKKEEN